MTCRSAVRSSTKNTATDRHHATGRMNGVDGLRPRPSAACLKGRAVGSGHIRPGMAHCPPPTGQAVAIKQNNKKPLFYERFFYARILENTGLANRNVPPAGHNAQPAPSPHRAGACHQPCAYPKRARVHHGPCAASPCVRSTRGGARDRPGMLRHRNCGKGAAAAYQVYVTLPITLRFAPI